jgi:hypothetical protein
MAAKASISSGYRWRLGIIAAALLAFGAWFLYDGSVDLKASPASMDHGRLALEFVFNGIFHFGQNILAFVLLSMVSPVTYSVASLIKRVFVIVMAIIWFRSPTTPLHVAESLGHRVGLILAAGRGPIGLESTVLDLSREHPAILRPGYISAYMISETIGKEVPEKPGEAESHRKSPGTRYTHYKPRATVSWLEEIPLEFEPDRYYIIHSHSQAQPGVNIHSYQQNFAAFARDLYDHFRTADHLSFSGIFIERLPENTAHPVISALKDRIKRSIGD